MRPGEKNIPLGKVLDSMSIIYPDLQTTREFAVITYKIIKNRNNDSGRNAICWEHFDDFEQIYGTKHAVNPTLQNLQASLKSTNGIYSFRMCNH